MTRLIASGLLAGWTARLRGRFAAHRAASAGGGGDSGGAWLEGDAAGGLACGTTTAWNKDKTRILHSHSPPARAG
jgi:hypothetical protein